MNLKNNKVKIGTLDRRIVIAQPTFEKDNYGALEEISVISINAWAHIKYSGGAEKNEANQIASFKGTDFTVRYNSSTATIKETNRVQYDGKEYEVIAVGEIEDQRKRFLIIKTELID